MKGIWNALVTAVAVIALLLIVNFFHRSPSYAEIEKARTQAQVALLAGLYHGTRGDIELQMMALEKAHECRECDSPNFLPQPQPNNAGECLPMIWEFSDRNGSYIDVPAVRCLAKGQEPTLQAKNLLYVKENGQFHVCIAPNGVLYRYRGDTGWVPDADPDSVREFKRRALEAAEAAIIDKK
jgi:hypothetical protein